MAHLQKPYGILAVSEKVKAKMFNNFSHQYSPKRTWKADLVLLTDGIYGEPASATEISKTDAEYRLEKLNTNMSRGSDGLHTNELELSASDTLIQHIPTDYWK